MPIIKETEDNPYNKRQKLGCFGVISLIIIGFWMLSFLGPAEKTEADLKHDAAFEREWQANDAYYTATNFVKNRLKSPSAAEFPKPKEARIQLLEDGATYKIYGYVDSQNSYGATLRVNWYVKLILNGNEWNLLDLKIYER